MIDITIRKPEKIPGVLNIFLKFTNYDKRLIDIARGFSDRKYNTDTKTWEIPLYKLKEVIRLYSTEIIHINYSKKQTKEIVGIPKNYTFRTKPYPHQWEGIKYLINKDNCLLADEQGLGKTFQSLNAINIRMQKGEVNKCLILCGVASLKQNWKKETMQHLGIEAKILGLRKRKTKDVYYMGSTEDKIYDLENATEKFLITNVETLIVEKFVKKLLKRKDINAIILDECHKCTANTESQRGHNLQKLSNIPYKIAMSGTPALNGPLDFRGVLKWLNVIDITKDDFKNFFFVYGEKYGKHEVVGYKNLHVLKQLLDTCMLRRLKEDVLDLPPKIYSTTYLEMGEKQQKIYDEVRTSILQDIDKISIGFNPLTKLIRLRQATNYTGTLSSSIEESVKIDWLVDFVEGITHNKKKCVIVSEWTEMTDELRKHFAQYNPAVMTGQFNDLKNEAEKERFQNDPECKVLIGTEGTLGTGHTLTAASYLIFTDLPWNKGKMDQVADRLHRIGTSGTVNIITLCCKDTIDERIQEIVYEKGVVIKQIMDGTNTQEKKDLLNRLLN